MGNIQKIVTIPAAMQKLPNPLPALQHPQWLHRKIAEQNDPFQQRKITNFFKKNNTKKQKVMVMDIEDMASGTQQHRDQSTLIEISTMNDTAMLEDSMLHDSELQDSELQESFNMSCNINDYQSAL